MQTSSKRLTKRSDEFCTNAWSWRLFLPFVLLCMISFRTIGESTNICKVFGSISTTTLPFNGPLLGNHVELMMLAISIFA